MDKFQHQTWSILVTLLLGMAFGWFLSRSLPDRSIEKELQPKIDSLMVEVEKGLGRQDSLNNLLQVKDSISVHNSTELARLEASLAKSKKEAQLLKDKVKKMSSDEKRNWLIDRYRN